MENFCDFDGHEQREVQKTDIFNSLATLDERSHKLSLKE